MKLTFGEDGVLGLAEQTVEMTMSDAECFADFINREENKDVKERMRVHREEFMKTYEKKYQDSSDEDEYFDEDEED